MIIYSQPMDAACLTTRPAETLSGAVSVRRATHSRPVHPVASRSGGSVPLRSDRRGYAFREAPTRQVFWFPAAICWVGDSQQRSESGSCGIDIASGLGHIYRVRTTHRRVDIVSSVVWVLIRINDRRCHKRGTMGWTVPVSPLYCLL